MAPPLFSASFFSVLFLFFFSAKTSRGDTALKTEEEELEMVLSFSMPTVEAT